MARHPRYAAPGLPQHVTQRGNNRSPIFAAEPDYLAFHESLRIACRRYRYIELNPVRAGMVDHPCDYRWSSHLANAYGATDSIVTPHVSYMALDVDDSTRLTAYRALFDGELDDADLAAVRESTRKGWALGGTRFREQIATMLGRRTFWPGRRSATKAVSSGP